jgi:hypothetical protein
MKTASRFLLLLPFVFLSASAYAQDPCSEGTAYRNCKACGSAKTKSTQALNVLKNRDVAATSPQKITVAEIRKPSNNKKFSPDMRVSVTAFVASVVSGGNQESCNCGRNDLRDIHINIVAKANEVGNLSKYVVVEFTPRWQKTFGLNDSQYQKMLAGVRKDIGGKWVKFEGWMLFDSMHENASKTTMPSQPTCPDDGKQHPKCNWRATPWEVHPVTKYTIVSGP